MIIKLQYKQKYSISYTAYVDELLIFSNFFRMNLRSLHKLSVEIDVLDHWDNRSHPTIPENGWDSKLNFMHAQMGKLYT